jgi:EAL domain-containing protein (putative c-di-GMP-specific phosphodiesterase class I)
LSLLLDAITRDHILLMRQPIFAIGADAPGMWEVLVRLGDQRGAIHPPIDFLTETKRLDLIRPLDRVIINESFRRSNRYSQKGTDLSLAINVAADSVNPGIAEHIVRCAENWEVSPDSVTLEITESAISLDEKSVRQFTDRLTGENFRIAIDDYGSGAISVEQIAALGMHTLKIGSGLVSTLADSDQNDEVASIVSRAKLLDLTVIAEFVDSQETLDIVDNLNVDCAQGYFLDKPEDFPLDPAA